MILLIDPVSELLGRLREARPDVDVDHVGDVQAAERVLEDEHTVDVIVLGPALHEDEALDVARKFHEAHPAISIVMSTMSEGHALYRMAMRAGVDDVLPARADLDEVRDVLARAIAETARRRTSGDTPEVRLGRTIATFATKGGCGKSFLATNLATLLAERYPGRVVLVDLDLQAGDAALMLQLVPERGLREAAELGDGLDDEALSGFLTPAGGLKVLAAPSHPIHAEEVTPETVARVLTLLRQMFEWVIIDGPPSFTEQMLSALEQMDVVAVVSSLDVPSIKNLRLSMETLRELGVPRERMKIVLNRADSKVGLTVREVEKSLGTTIDLQLPSSREVPFAVNQGLAIVAARPKSAVAKALRASLALFDQSAPQTGRRRG